MEKKLPDKPITDSIIGLILSHNCNLSCTYCYIPCKSDVVMPFELAKSLLAPRLELDEEKPLSIEFMGAEPLTAFDRMKEIVEWAKNGNFKRGFGFFATTNGTLLNEEMKKWFYENRDIVFLCLSYDGTDETQDANRSNSAQKIDLQFFLKTWPTQPLKCTIPEHAVKSMAEGIIRLSDMGFALFANAAYEDYEWKEESIAEYERQLAKLVDYYVEHPDKYFASLVNYDLLDMYNRRNDHQGPCCNAQFGYGIFDADGKSYACQTLSPLVIGTESAERACKILKETKVNFQDPRCADCILKGGCQTCMGINYAKRNDFAKRSALHCRLTKSEVIATCILKTKLLLQKKEKTQEDADYARAISCIYKALVN